MLLVTSMSKKHWISFYIVLASYHNFTALLLQGTSNFFYYERGKSSKGTHWCHIIGDTITIAIANTKKNQKGHPGVTSLVKYITARPSTSLKNSHLCCHWSGWCNWEVCHIASSHSSPQNLRCTWNYISF